jgi:uncharacterized caspase-like protein
MAKRGAVSEPQDAPPGASGRRGRDVAIVIGIDSYRNWPRLDRASRDAAEVAAALQRIGFQAVGLLGDRATRDARRDPETGS